jgi:uncharacterized protein with ParB-like and HNH nuclease domain
VESQQDLAIRGEIVQHIYGQFVAGRFLVNRRYQRKLVWTVEKKEAFIDSIAQGYPIPLILIAEVKHDRKPRYEIIDGLQRLDAIASFIEGGFHIGGQYFDLQTMAETMFRVDKGELRKRQPVLDRALCTRIASYVVPLSICVSAQPNHPCRPW